METHDKLWGSELWIVNNELYCGKILTLREGYQCSLHYHKNKHETFYVLSGRVRMEFGMQTTILLPGDSVVVPPLTPHRFAGLMDSQIIEFSTHHEDDDSYRIENSRKI